MQSQTPTTQDNQFPMELKSDKNIQYEQNVSSQKRWHLKHPNLQENFFQKIEPPSDLDDAQIKMHCHVQTVEDIDLQLEMNEVEMSMCHEDGELLPYNKEDYTKLEEHRLRLYWGKKFHMNARNAYWYYLTQISREQNNLNHLNKMG